MIQLRVYNNGNQYWLDLYEESPIKLTLSVEDITDASAASTFSRTFRVPNTNNNYYFFQTAFMVDGIDYDVTVKKNAEILVDGQTFKQGHIRLQKIYNNEDFSKVDYEIVFLGETRDFASSLGDKPLCQIPLDLTHTLTRSNIIDSWDAYPQGGANDGLFNGDVIYPLIDHGNRYVDGVVQEAQIKTDTSSHSKSFTQNSHPIFPNRFKPMIRAKAIIDAIFSQTPYEYESTFLNSFLFKKVYVSAFGNDSSPFADTTATDNLFDGTNSNPLFVTGPGVYTVPIDTEQLDPADNFDSTTYTYTVPVTGDYTFSAEALSFIESNPGTFATCTAEIWVNGALRTSGSSGPFSVSIYTTESLTVGDTVQFRVRFSPETSSAVIENFARLEVLNAPGDFNPTVNLDCEYKQIDFFKDILTAFRLVIAPVRDDPFKFKIEPWNNYIAQGEIFDWSDKLDRNKDIQLEPLFFTQKERIEFKFSEDEDYINNYNQNAFKEVYGQLNFDSGSELLKDTRIINVGFAPTPVTQIEGDPDTSSWIVPQLHQHDSDDGTTLHEPIRPKTRLLFYTGTHDTTEDWYFQEATNVQSYSIWPLVHYQENWPPQANDLNLNWARWFAYYNQDGALTGYDPFAGQSLYQRYWSSYIATLYNKYSRRMTATFILDHLDLVDLTFDDVIFVDGAYWRPEKIIDAPVGEKSPVKVQLIKLNNFRPETQGGPPEFFYYEVQTTNCSENGNETFILQSPVDLSIGNIVSVVGSTECYIVINNSSNEFYDLVWSYTWGPDQCQTCLANEDQFFTYLAYKWGENCDKILVDSVVVQSTIDLTLGDTVTLTVNSGCWYIAGVSQLLPQDIVVSTSTDCYECQGITPPQNYWYYAEPCAGGSQVTVVTQDPNPTGDVVSIDGLIGCWTILGSAPIPIDPAPEIVNTYTDCAECETENPTNYELVSCLDDPDTGLPLEVVANNSNGCTFNIGDVVSVQGSYGCWTVQQSTNTPATATISCVNVGTDCVDCYTNNLPSYKLQQCDGTDIVYALSFVSLSAGQAVKLDNLPGCWEVIEFNDEFHPTSLVTNIYIDCDLCSNPSGFNWNTNSSLWELEIRTWSLT